MELSSRQLASIAGLGAGVVLELLCAILVIKRDINFRGNQFTALAYLNIAIGVFINVIYVFVLDPAIVGLLHRMTNFFVIIGTIFLFLAAMFIYGGNELLKSFRMILPAIAFIVGLLLFVLPGVFVYTGETALPGSEQFIKWDLSFFAAAASPIYMLVIGTFHYYYSVYKDIPPDMFPIKRAIGLILIGIVLLGVCHFLLVVPHVLLDVFPLSMLSLIGNIGSIGVLVGSFTIFWGFRTRISEK
ncbi:MAG: hypothetical protein ACFE9L_10095 [Candidatus Hodarchaeota archaeon]